MSRLSLRRVGQDTLDPPALLRPGRLDCKIEFPQPDKRQQKRMVFQAATSKRNLRDELDLEDYISGSEKISCADVMSGKVWTSSHSCSTFGVTCIFSRRRHMCMDIVTTE